MGHSSSFLKPARRFSKASQSKPEKQVTWRSDDTQTKRTISTGALGSVIEATHIRTNQPCAIKIFEYETREEWPFQYAQKKSNLLLALAKLQHPNIVHTHACETIEVENSFNLKNRYIIIMDLCDQNLASVINKKRQGQVCFQESELLKGLLQLVSALHEAQKIGYHHYAVKDENIFLRKDNQHFTIGDFDVYDNLSKNSNPKSLTFQPPEFMSIISQGPSQDYSKADIYSLGIVFLKLALLKDELTPSERIDVKKMLPLVVNRGFPRLYMVLGKMIERDPSRRPGFADLISSLQELICELKGYNYYNDELASFYLIGNQKKVKELIEKGDVERGRENYKQAVTHYEKARDEIFQSSQLKQYDRYLLSLALGNLGNCFLEMKDFQQAMKCSLKSLKIRNTHLNGYKEYSSLIAIAKVYNRLGDFQNGLVYYMKAYENAQTGGETLGMVKCLEGIGFSYENLGDLEAACSNHGQALLVISESFGVKNMQYSNNLRTLARICKLMGKNDNVKLLEKKIKEIGL